MNIENFFAKNEENYCIVKIGRILLLKNKYLNWVWSSGNVQFEAIE